jgi:hypothetical protein
MGRDTFFFLFHMIISPRKDVGEPQALICTAGKAHGVWVKLLLEVVWQPL